MFEDKNQISVFNDAFEGKLDNVKTFVDNNKENVNISDKDGKTLLHWAISGKKLDIIDYLVTEGADINAKDAQGHTSLYLAKEGGSYEIIKYLIQKGAFDDSSNALKTPKGIVSIRKVSLNDIAPLKEVCCRTFFETFADQNTPEDMQKYLDTNFSEEQISKEISTPGSQFYIAFLDDKPVAYLKLNIGDAQTEKQGDDSMEVQRIYVTIDSKGCRIGTLLMDRAEEEAIRSGCARIWLGVWEHNEPAIRFYTKRGFTRFGEHVFVLGNDAQTDYLMEKIM